MTQILNLGINSHDNKYSVYNSRFIIQNDLFKNIQKEKNIKMNYVAVFEARKLKKIRPLSINIFHRHLANFINLDKDS